jgi:hypothetical protein
MSARAIWLRVVVTLAIIAAITYLVSRGWIDKDVHPDQAITQLMMAGVGLVTTWIVGNKNVPRLSRSPNR